MKKILLIAIHILIFRDAYGLGQERGNGGDVVQCSNSYTVLDYYEYGFFLNAVDEMEIKDDHYLTIMNKLINSISPFDFVTYKHLTEIKKDYLSNVVFVDRLVDIDDSYNFPLGRGCDLRQAARFIRNEDRSGHYEIVQNVWKKLDNVNKAGLMLHEIIYIFYKDKNKNYDSLHVREFNRLLVKMFLSPSARAYSSHKRFLGL